ncbi:MAG: hypothetical protein JWN44_7255 [Myxococcales bacterium]|nr:hypothetical protein [Myxococcales bacterium]
MASLLVLALAGAMVLVPQKDSQHTKSDNAAARDVRGTPQAPAIVKVLPPEKTRDEADAESREKKEHADNEGLLSKSTLALAVITGLLALGTGVLAAFTYKLWTATTEMVGKADTATGKQSSDMRDSITEMGRIANSVHESAKVAASSVAAIEEMKTHAQMQMRAYLSVGVGNGTYQERERGFYFDVRPVLLNSGNTPAHKVGFRVAAEILPVPLPDHFTFPLPDQIDGGLVLGPGARFDLFGRVPNFVPDDEVVAIKKGHNRAVYIWGKIVYEDVFGAKHHTNFCQQIIWLENVGVYGIYQHRHNDAD